MTQGVHTANLLQQAISLLQQQQSEQAAERFEQLLAHSPDIAQAWLGLAFARANLQQDAMALDAIDKCLQLEPRNIRALLFKADQLCRMAQPRKSLAFYEAAGRLAASANGDIAPDIKQGLARGQQILDQYSAEYGDFLLQGLKQRGYEPNSASRRFKESLDICLGRKQIYVQQPSRYYFPGLPQRQFYEREEFDWIPALEARTHHIRGELLNLLQDASAFSPYLTSDQDIPEINTAGYGIINNPDWGACYLWEYGSLVEETARLCPQTVAAMQQVPLADIPGQTPIVLFSRLAANTHIPPHHGLLNTRLICHLPLIVPENCGALRCGNESRPWEEGKTLIFDDSIEHEAWNRSSQQRIVLLFDIWRPELTHDERTLVSMMLQVVKEYEAAN